MTALPLTGAQRRRPTVRAVMLVAVAIGCWAAWSPGTRFGLGGAYGGWLYASIRLLDAGLVPLVVVGALAGAAPRERRVDEYVRATGVATARLVGAVTVSGVLLALVVSVAFAVGAAAGGLLRAVTNGGSWWADPGASVGVVDPLLTDLRLLLAAGLAGAVGALVGWIVRREDLAVGLAVAATVIYLPELSALFRRLPVVIDVLAFSPMGAIRATALANRGLAAEGFAAHGSPLVFGAVVACWLAVLVSLAVPGSAGHRRRPETRADSATATATATGRPSAMRRARLAVLAGATILTVGFGAVVPGRAADALPWRWQRSWRAAERAGWSSPQTVDRYVESLRADPKVESPGLLVAATAVAPTVAESVQRASRVERQPLATMASPDYVVVRLEFDEPIVSGSMAFSAYLVRFALRADPEQRWQIIGAEGPVADAGVVVGDHAGAP